MEKPKAAPPAEKTGEILAGFASAVGPVKKTAPYTIGVLLTVICLAMMPVAYLGIMVVIGGLSVLHLVYNQGILGWQISSWVGLLVKVFCYFGPALGAAAMIFFMIKPFFRKPERPIDTILLSDGDAPDFFNFVSAICRCVGAGSPSEIRISNQVNASASFVDDARGLFSGKLCLTIGLPLLAGLNTRSLAGVIAHEFGHFAQGTAMRITYLIRSFIYFFQRVIYERDSFDEQIEAASQRSDYRIRPFIYLARLMIGVSRFVLRKASYLGMLVGMYTMRQMEFDADRYEIRLAGSDQFPKTAADMRSLGIAWYEADRIAADCFNEDNALPDNFGTLMRFALQKLTPEALENLSREQLERKAGKMDSHPSDAERNSAAASDNAPGIFTIEEDARVLFPDFEAIAQQCTKRYFSCVTGRDVSNTPVYDALAMANYVKETEGYIASYRRQFGEVAGIFAPMPLSFGGADTPSEDQAVIKARIVSAREKIIGANKLFDEAATSLVNVQAGLTALNAGYTIAPGQFGFDECTVDGANLALADSLVKLERARETLNAATVPLRQRLQYAFSRLEADGENHDDLQTITSLSYFFQDQRGNIAGLLETYQRVTFLLNQAEIVSPLREVELSRLLSGLRENLAKVREAAKPLAVPFARKPENRMLEPYLFHGTTSDARSRNEFIADVGRTIQSAGLLYQLVHGRLAGLVEKRESRGEDAGVFYAFPPDVKEKNA